MAEATDVMLRTILEDCRDGMDGIGFNEVVVMLESTAASAEVYMDFDDLRFTPDGRIVTLMVPGGTHMHLDMSKIREAEFIPTPPTTRVSRPTSCGCATAAAIRPCAFIFASRTTTPPTRRATTSSCRLLEKYPGKIALPIDPYGAAGEHP